MGSSCKARVANPSRIAQRHRASRQCPGQLRMAASRKTLHISKPETTCISHLTAGRHRGVAGHPGCGCCRCVACHLGFSHFRRVQLSGGRLPTGAAASVGGQNKNQSPAVRHQLSVQNMEERSPAARSRYMTGRSMAMTLWMVALLAKPRMSTARYCDAMMRRTSFSLDLHDRTQKSRPKTGTAARRCAPPPPRRTCVSRE